MFFILPILDYLPLCSHLSPLTSLPLPTATGLCVLSFLFLQPLLNSPWIPFFSFFKSLAQPWLQPRLPTPTEPRMSTTFFFASENWERNATRRTTTAPKSWRTRFYKVERNDRPGELVMTLLFHFLFPHSFALFFSPSVSVSLPPRLRA